MGVVRERLEEEIGRAERYGTGLSCLLIVFENLEQLAREHGQELRAQTLEYVARALRAELRRFDRIGRAVGEHDQLIVILPGTDSTRGEIVARRALERMRTIKVESRGARLPLEVSVGLAAWREDMTAEALLAAARAAARSSAAEGGLPSRPPAMPSQAPASGSAAAAERRPSVGVDPADVTGARTIGRIVGQ